MDLSSRIPPNVGCLEDRSGDVHTWGTGPIVNFDAELQAGGEGLGLRRDETRSTNLDLALEYASLKVHDSQSNLAARSLDVVDAVLGIMCSVAYELGDAEAAYLC